MSSQPYSFHIHLRGRVQGVGFRPFVYRLAQAWGLNGMVCNAPDGVHIDLDAPEETAQKFYQTLLEQSPRLSVITAASFSKTTARLFKNFSIAESDEQAAPEVLLTPDFALCPDCRAELQSPEDRRYGYAFITCTNCGPRYSIVNGLPYDRPLTTMQPFQMCPTCQAEYDNPLDRRYFSQTNSCPDCGIQLSVFPDADLGQETAFDFAIRQLNAGKILAVKGIGGYLLMCDATNASSVRTLRARKHRPSKPFAVLYANTEMLAADVEFQPDEIQVLTGPVAPIVLLPLKIKPASEIATEDLAPGLTRLGVMLPYAPLLQLLADGVGRPLVATSGNISHAPIVFQDQTAQQELAEIADFVLSHNREIVLPQDDSVLRFTEKHRIPVWLRRSRGLAPSLLIPGFEAGKQAVFCAGADLKSAFVYTQSGNLYLSQYLGDLESFETQEHYRLVVEHFMAIFKEKPVAVVCDAHPAYFSRQIAQTLAENWGAPLIPVQHHKAHFAAVLAENKLLNSQEPVLGVIWDGTGYGDDGQIWGGEWFLWQNRNMERVLHWDYFPYLASDKMAKEPRIAALSACPADAFLRPLFSEKEWAFYHNVLKNKQLTSTSSVGRLFDAAAAVLGLATRNTYEGEAALLLESMARTDETPFDGLFINENGTVDTRAFLQEIVAQRRAGVPVEIIAGKMHRTLIEIIRASAQRFNVQKIAFSGGVFQNALLVDLLQEHLGVDFQLHFHQQISPNDENIALGQLVLHQNQTI